MTGGGQGIGRGIAIELAAAGADVVVAHRPTSNDTVKAKNVVREVRALGRRAFSVSMDVGVQRSIDRAFERVFSLVTRVDILVNNAGVMQSTVGINTTSEDFDRCYTVNLRSIWIVTRGLIDHFKAHRSGGIVNIASIAGRRGSPELPAYCASKAGVLALTQSMASELGPLGIRVNAVCPGIVATPMSEQFARLIKGKAHRDRLDMSRFLRKFTTAVPTRRLPTAEDIGRAVVFLASENAKSITGQGLNVDAGYWMN